MNGNRALPSMEVTVREAADRGRVGSALYHRASRLAHARFSKAWGGAAVRVAFGMVWLADAALKWLPAYRTNFLDQLRAGAQGQPRWLHPWFHLVVRLVSPRIALFA